MPNLREVSTSNGYTQATSLVGLRPIRRVTVQVANNPIHYQFSVSTAGRTGLPGSEQWLPPGDDALLYPGFWTFGQEDFDPYVGITGFRIRSGIADNSAVVTVITP